VVQNGDLLNGRGRKFSRLSHLELAFLLLLLLFLLLFLFPLIFLVHSECPKLRHSKCAPTPKGANGVRVQQSSRPM